MVGGRWRGIHLVQDVDHEPRTQQHADPLAVAGGGTPRRALRHGRSKLAPASGTWPTSASSSGNQIPDRSWQARCQQLGMSDVQAGQAGSVPGQHRSLSVIIGSRS